MSKQPKFDVFLSHNSKDKENVRRLADELTARNLRVWLDERELQPGQPWQEALEKVIQEVTPRPRFSSVGMVSVPGRIARCGGASPNSLIVKCQ